jgi:hypothetical protein
MTLEMKTFRVGKPDRPPTPFRFVFEVQQYEKKEIVPANGDTPAEYQEVPVDPPVWVEEERMFHVQHGKVPAGLVMAIQNVDQTNPASGAAQGRAIERLIELSVVEDEEFSELLRSERTVVSTAVLNETINWLIEETSVRPTNTP